MKELQTKGSGVEIPEYVETVEETVTDEPDI